MGGGLSLCIQLLHLDQARIPMYQGRALGWVGGLKVVKTRLDQFFMAVQLSGISMEQPFHPWRVHYL